MIAQPQPLIEVFAEIPDFRRCRGKRHPLPAILSLTYCAMLCGSRSYSAIAEWGRNYGTRIAHALGFTHNPPCAATLHTVFRHVDRDAVEAKLGAWAEGVIEHTRGASAGEAAIALDGITLRGLRKQGAPRVHLLSALSHHLGLTLAQQGVDDKTNEITQVETVLHQLVLQGRVCTMDALLTQRQVAQSIVEKGGDYVMIVKENQPQLRADIELVFMLPPAGDRQETARTVDIGHGRIEQRNITTSAALVGYSDWPGPAQVFELKALCHHPKNGQGTGKSGLWGHQSASRTGDTWASVGAGARGSGRLKNKSH